jgi:hypothetical protein
MKNWIFLVLALAAVWYVITRRAVESFVPEFLDQGNVQKRQTTLSRLVLLPDPFPELKLLSESTCIALIWNKYHCII